VLDNNAEKNLDTFADRFRHARQRSGLSLAKIAEHISVSTQAVWNYENRPDGSVSVEVLFPLADVLAVEPRWLATGHGVMFDSETSSAEAQRVEKVAKSLAVLTDEKLSALSVLLGIKL
jgi:transcriptional regulator with XRE-family HTH domain